MLKLPPQAKTKGYKIHKIMCPGMQRSFKTRTNKAHIIPQTKRNHTHIFITLIHGKFIHLSTDLSEHQFIFIDVGRRDTIDNILVCLPYRARFIISIGHFFQYLHHTSVSEIRHKCFFASLNMTCVLNWSAPLNSVQSPTDDACVQKKTFDFITDSNSQLNTMWICLQTHGSSRGLHHHAVLHPSILDILHVKSSSRKHSAMITSLQ